MPVYSPPKRFRVDRGITELESHIGVKKGFTRRLLKEDDWSFVIKLHAVFEAVCAHLLLHHFQEPALNDVLGRLELSGRTTGKVTFLSKLDLISAGDRRYITVLSELRNSLVHDVRMTEFVLTEYVAALHDEQLKSQALAFSPHETFIRSHPFSAELQLGYTAAQVQLASVENMIRRFREKPKLHIWLGGYNALVALVDMYGYSDYRRWAKES
jgi:hypothetical protein